MLEQMGFISANFQKIQRMQSQQISATDLLGLHFFARSAGMLEQMVFISANFQQTQQAQTQQISATDLLGLELHHFLLEVVGCWNKYRWFLYKQIFRKFSTHCPAPSTYCQLICSLFLEGVNDEENG